MGEELYVADRSSWRSWLAKNHSTKREVWLIYYNKRSKKSSIPYDDSVEEALCFGWIDSIIKKLDDKRFARKFTPRKGSSRWSDANKKRARRMIAEGKMTETGMARIKEAQASGEWFKTAPIRKHLPIPSFLKDALDANRKASDNFNRLADTYKTHFVGWITSAKREETRKRRLAEAIKLLEQNQKLGMK